MVSLPDHPTSLPSPSAYQSPVVDNTEAYFINKFWEYWRQTLTERISLCTIVLLGRYGIVLYARPG